jgi:hypothetical protein
VAWTMFNQSGANDSLFACRLNKRGDVVWTTLVRSDTLDFAPSVCGDGRGGIVVAWHEMQAGRWLVMLQLFDSTGVAQWGPTGVRALETSSSHTTGSLLRQRPGGMVVGCFAREQHGWRIRAQMLNLAGNRLWSPAGVAVSPEYSAVACMRTVEGGGTHTLWLWTGLVLDTYKLYAQRLDSIGSRQWDTLGVYVGSTRDATPWRFEAAPDGRGGAIPVWLVHMDGQNWDIRTQRVDAQGGLCWGDTGLVVIGDTNVQRWTPSVIPDAGGGAILGWEDYRYGPPSRTSVYAQRVGDASALCGRRDAKGAARTVTAITTNKEVTYTRSNCGPGSSLLVYGCAGVLIRRVAIPAAASAVSWDCRDGSGVSVPAGTYFLVEEHAGLPSICRVTLLPAW